MAEETSPIDREPKTLQAGRRRTQSEPGGQAGNPGRRNQGHLARRDRGRHPNGGGRQGGGRNDRSCRARAAETTVHAVQGAAHSTSKAMGWAFDLPAHVRRNPWAMMGGAMFLGLAAGYLIGRLRR